MHCAHTTLVLDALCMGVRTHACACACMAYACACADSAARCMDTAHAHRLGLGRLTLTLALTLTLTLTLTQASLGKLSALVEAHLSFNQLRSPLPAGLGGLARLKVLRARDSDARP